MTKALRIRTGVTQLCTAKIDLRDTWRDVSTALNRIVILMIAVAAVFVLFRLDNTAKVTVGGFELTLGASMHRLRRGVPDRCVYATRVGLNGSSRLLVILSHAEG